MIACWFTLPLFCYPADTEASVKIQEMGVLPLLPSLLNPQSSCTPKIANIIAEVAKNGEPSFPIDPGASWPSVPPLSCFFLFSPLCLHSSLLVLSLWICALFCIVEDFIFWIRMSEESNSNAFVSQAISDRHHVLPVLLAISELSCHNCEAIFWGLRPCTAAVPESIHYL